MLVILAHEAKPILLQVCIYIYIYYFLTIQYSLEREICSATKRNLCIYELINRLINTDSFRMCEILI